MKLPPYAGFMRRSPPRRRKLFGWVGGIVPTRPGTAIVRAGEARLDGGLLRKDLLQVLEVVVPRQAFRTVKVGSEITVQEHRVSHMPPEGLLHRAPTPPPQGFLGLL